MPQAFKHIFKNSGIYRVVQRLTGYTGCVIQTDSVNVYVTKGLTFFDTLNVLNSTILNNNALVYWNKFEGAVLYQVFKNGLKYNQVSDTFYYENVPYKRDVSYSIAGIDSCGNYSSIGRDGKPIFLQVNMLGYNDASHIVFSPYKTWKENDLKYQIQKKINGIWSNIQYQINTTPYTDNDFLNKDSSFACYRIEAFEKNSPGILTYSNEVCLPYIPTIFIPNTFSPNNDGINDVFAPVCFGIKNYQLTVLNRWGEIVFKGKVNESWDGKSIPEGVYTTIVQYITNEDKVLQQKLNVTLYR